MNYTSHVQAKTNCTGYCRVNRVAFRTFKYLFHSHTSQAMIETSRENMAESN